MLRLKLFHHIFLAFFVLFMGISAGTANNRVTVVKVVDGDTLRIEMNGREEAVRLIGIDTPENKINKKAWKDSMKSNQDLETITSMGKEAARYVRTLVRRGDTVGIEFDIQKRDKYNRLLVYAYLPDGKMLNEEIIKAGYANIMTYPPNVRYQDRFIRAYRGDTKRSFYHDL